MGFEFVTFTVTLLDPSYYLNEARGAKAAYLHEGTNSGCSCNLMKRKVLYLITSEVEESEIAN
jgi:hypothetical protein